MDKMKKIIVTLFLFLLLHNCISLQNRVIGVWKLTAEINSDNLYANRSSLKETKVNSNKMITLHRDSTFISDLSLCNQWPASDFYISKGTYHFKKRNSDKLFWLECTGMYPDHHFKLRNKKLELYYPSVAGYHIQIFEKTQKK